MANDRVFFCWRQASLRSRATTELVEKVAQEQLEGGPCALYGRSRHVCRTQVRTHVLIVDLFVHLSVCLYACLSVFCLSSFFLSVCLSIQCLFVGTASPAFVGRFCLPTWFPQHDRAWSRIVGMAGCFVVFVDPSTRKVLKAGSGGSRVSGVKC